MVKLYYTTISCPNDSEAAHRLLQIAWRENRSDPMPLLCRTGKGKPYFSENPLFFSLAHSKTMAFCLLADQPVGVDGETIRPISERVVQRVLSPKEWAQYKNAPNATFFCFWTLKEALAKYLGDGLQGFPNQTEFDLSALQKSSPAFQLRQIGDCMTAICMQRFEACDYLEK